ncbi:MAG: DUF92 domain-containing protein [Bacteroidetes bacterium]|nr:DUF92 domain-containing protein [Bacteroidota bacterium]
MIITTTDLVRLGILAAAILALLVLSEAARRLFGWPDEVTRKTVHVATGLVIFFAPPFFPHAGAVMLIAALFVAVNAAAYARGWLKAVHHTERKSFGTVYYPLALLLLAAPFWSSSPDLVVASIMVMAIGDAAAGIVGESVRKPRLFRVTSDHKSVQGSAAMALGSLTALLAALLVYDSSGLAFGRFFAAYPAAVVAALAAITLFVTGWEATSSRGLDNLTVPLMTAAALHICFVSGVEADALRFAAGAGLGLAIAAAAHAARMLQPSGAVATFLLATIIFGIGGWQWTLPIFVFFILSSLLSKWRKRQKAPFESMFEKSGNRDAGQVAANGAIVGALALIWHFTGDERLYLLSLVAVAVVTADTWGTEIGVLAHRQPRSVLSGRRVPPGTSGGISLTGSLGGVAGATIVTLPVLLFIPLSPRQFIAIVVFGALGSLIDSVLGATVQAQYRCTVCGKDTEKPMHCDAPALRLRGLPWLRNDVVNLVSTVIAVTLAALLLQLS